MTIPGSLNNAHPSGYRADIDGLRALAVLPVLLFHARLGCPGGYVGVDIFFVISGFLISTLILKDIGKGNFKLAMFWERRIRRILPAVTVVILATLIAGWLIYLPEDFEALGKSVVAQVALVSNVFFYRQAGYFEAGADAMPLLHTWSLAVEEQFYLLFPLLLVFLARQKRISVAKGILVLGSVSLVLSAIGTYTHAWATFYLLPARAWELLAGAWLASMRGRISVGQHLREVFGWLGFGLIGWPMIFYDGDTRFPGLAAIPPCLGAVLIIFSSDSRLSLVGRMLAWRPVVFIGLISYSLYLWHWPVLVFSEYVRPDPASWYIRAGLLLASIALAALSWKYIETPFRKRVVCPRRSQVFALAGVSVLGLLLLGGGVAVTRGMPSRLSPQVLSLANGRHDRDFLNEITLKQAVVGRFVELGGQHASQPIEVLIWGDSHAMAVTPVLDDLCRRFSKRGIQATVSATAPVIDYVSRGRFSLGEQSPEFASAVIAYIEKHKVRTVILAALWNSYAESDGFKSSLLESVRTIIGTGANVYILKVVPRPNFDVPRIAALTVKRREDPELLGETPGRYQEENAKMAQTYSELSQMGVKVLEPAEYFLNSKGMYGVVKDGRALYCDSHHLSVAGSRLLAPLFEPIFHEE